MSDIKSLLNETANPMVQLMSQTRGLVSKWEKTGLLEGVKGDMDKSHMSILLENQAKQLIDEATRTGTSANSEQWAGVALPLVRRVFAEIAAKEFVSVQPMNLPSGLVFYLDFKYGSNQAGKPSFNGQSLFGGTGTKLGSTDSATNGLYGQGRFGYTMNDQYTTVTGTSTTGSWLNAKFVPELSASVSDGKIMRITADLTGTGYDATGIRAFTVSGSGIVDFYPAFTTVDAATDVVTFVVSGSGISATPSVLVAYHKQPEAASRGDFEDQGAGLPNATGVANDIGIPEVNLELKSEAIVAKTRKLKAVWTPELAQDLNAYHSIDAEAELTALLSEYVSMEIDLEILDMLVTAAPAATTEYWSARIGSEYSTSLGKFYDTAANRTAYVKSTWFQTLGNKIQKVSNKIHQLTLRGGANFLVCSPDVATIIESIPGFTTNTDGDQAKFAMGVAKVGALSNRWTVYKNPYMTDNVMLVGFRGTNFLETGAVYAPYIPLIQTPLVYDPVNFTPRRGVMTRYAKKVLRPEFFGKIVIGNLDEV
jgi:flagellin-like hook-associated protein FlgL